MDYVMEIYLNKNRFVYKSSEMFKLDRDLKALAIP